MAERRGSGVLPLCSTFPHILHELSPEYKRFGASAPRTGQLVTKEYGHNQGTQGARVPAVG
jgi:hypothetical protein